MTTLIHRHPGRNRVSIALTTVVLALSGCAGTGSSGPALAADAPLPDEVADGTTLIVGDPVTQRALELSGEADEFSFDIEWANLSGGPQTSEAFRADALDVGAVAEIPAIHATWTGLPVKIVAAKFRHDPLEHPVYELAVSAGSEVTELSQLRGKRIAYSPGQAQGALVLRVLDKAGLSAEDVTLVELPSTGDAYPNALASDEVDVAPVGGVALKRYLAEYSADGASSIRHGIRDDPSHLYVRTETLEDAGKAAAIADYVAAWARASAWVYEHPQEWIDGYYVDDQGLEPDDGEYLVDNAGKPDIPASWDEVIGRHQETVDLLAAETGNDAFPAEELFDRRYEGIAASAIKAGD